MPTALAILYCIGLAAFLALAAFFALKPRNQTDPYRQAFGDVPRLAGDDEVSPFHGRKD